MGILAKPIPFGDYFLLEKINTGGMAEVFKAKSFGVEGFERILAVKRILPTIAEDNEFITMFIDEAKISVQLTHANIAQVFDLGNIDGQYYIAMEYVPGRDLRVIFDRAAKTGQKLGIDCVCYIISRLCEGLDYAHKKKDANGRPLSIVHRDISPQNVLISYDGECKLIDFGIAKAAGKSSATQVGILKGKFSYMSPEQVSGKSKIDHRSDIFALGIVLFEMLTLKRLFLGSSDFSTLEKIRKVEVSPPTLYNPNIPEELEDIVLKALEKDVSLRYQSAHEMQEAIQKFMFNQKMYYTAKDLSDFCHQMFAQEISLEQKKAEFYKELTRDVLNKSRLEDMDEDTETEMSFYSRQAIYPSPDFSIDHLPAQRAPKQAIYDELDDFIPPEDDGIVYTNPKSPESAVHVRGDGLAFDPQLPPPKRSLVSAPVIGAMESSDSIIVEDQWMLSDKRHNKTNVLVWVVAALLLVIGIIAGVYLYNQVGSQRTVANAAFKISPEGIPYSLEINGKPYTGGINGKPHTGLIQQSLITLDPLPQNENIEYRIKADGYAEAQGVFRPSADEFKTINVALKAKLTTDLQVFIEPKSAQLYVDDVLIPGQGNYRITHLEAGTHKIRIVKDDYKDITREINLLNKEPLKLNISLSPAFASLYLESTPSDAKFVVKSLNNGQVVADGTTSKLIPKLPVDDEFEITVEYDGRTAKKVWTPRKDGEQDLIQIQIPVPKVAQVEAPTREASPSPARRPSTRPRENPAPAREPSPASSAPAKEVRAADSSAPGILRINSKPPATILINGKSYGNTPKKVELSAGSYTIRFINAEAGIDSEEKITLGAGELKTVMRK